MQRRNFLAAIATLAAWPLRAPAQQAKLARIGFLGAATAQGYARQLEGLRAGLQDHGYIEGQKVALEFRWAEGRYDRLSALARDLVQQRRRTGLRSAYSLSIQRNTRTLGKLARAPSGPVCRRWAIARVETSTFTSDTPMGTPLVFRPWLPSYWPSGWM
jgi:hypothetical protein